MANEILRVGFPTNDEVTVEEHFGHCEKFVVYSVKEGEIVKKEVLDAPEHAPGVFPKFIAENNINVVITGGMGQRAIDLIKANGGQVILGASGEIKEVLEVYLQGSLYSKGSAPVTSSLASFSIISYSLVSESTKIKYDALPTLLSTFESYLFSSNAIAIFILSSKF